MPTYEIFKKIYFTQPKELTANCPVPPAAAETTDDKTCIYGTCVIGTVL